MLQIRAIRENFDGALALATDDKGLSDKVTGVIMEHLSESEFGVDELARELGMSRTRLFAKIKEVSGMTPNAFMRTIRLRRAAELMSQNDAWVNEVCYEIGFTSRSHFTKCFQEQFGMSPSDYRKLHVSNRNNN